MAAASRWWHAASSSDNHDVRRYVHHSRLEDDPACDRSFLLSSWSHRHHAMPTRSGCTSTSLAHCNRR